MVKKTFIRLPEEKQDLITEAFMREFARHDFAYASLSQVVKQLGIAKGSVYQYFGSKMDLYQYLLAKSQEVKMSYVLNLRREDYPDFWAFYREMFIQGVRFDLERPIHSQFLFRTSQDRSNPELKVILDQNFRQSLDIFTMWIQAEQEQGLLSIDFSPEFIAYTIVKQSMAIQEYLLEIVGHDPEVSIQEDNQVFAGKKEQILHYVDQSITMFRKSFMN